MTSVLVTGSRAWSDYATIAARIAELPFRWESGRAVRS